MSISEQVVTRTATLEVLSDNGEWPWYLSTDMFREHGCPCVYDLAESGTPRFTDFGSENLKQTIRDYRRHGTVPPPRTKSAPQ